MLNSRGNEYSRNHTVLDPNDSEFWNFSWHEIGLYDLPASIDYILQQTNKTALYFSGLSEGSTVMYVMCSNLPEYNEKIKLYIHLAPVAFLDHAKSTFVTHPAAALGVIKVSNIFIDFLLFIFNESSFFLRNHRNPDSLTILYSASNK